MNVASRPAKQTRATAAGFLVAKLMLASGVALPQPPHPPPSPGGSWNNNVRVYRVPINGALEQLATGWLENASSNGAAPNFVVAGAPRGGVWSATSQDVVEWEDVTSPALLGADPGAVKLRGTDWLVLPTTPPARNVTPPHQRPHAPPPL